MKRGSGRRLVASGPRGSIMEDLRKSGGRSYWGAAKETSMLVLKRAYEKAAPDDGIRFLVERLWPRGIKKGDLRIDAWLKDLAPSNSLRRWFAHDPKKWSEFQHRYFAELDRHPEACEQIHSAARRGRVTLVYSAHDTEHNNAVALREYLKARMGQKRRLSHT